MNDNRWRYSPAAAVNDDPVKKRELAQLLDTIDKKTVTPMQQDIKDLQMRIQKLESPENTASNMDIQADRSAERVVS